MALFLIWIGILFLGVAGFFAFLMMRRNKGFRFQTRLTSLFLLLTLAPSVPLIFLSIALINQGIESSRTLEGVFDNAIAAIRTQLTDRNNAVLDRFNSEPNTNNSREILDSSGTHYLLQAWTQHGTLYVDTLYALKDAAGTSTILDVDFFESVMSGEVTDQLDKENRIFENYRIDGDASFKVIGMPVDSETIDTIVRIEQAITSFGLIYLFFIQGDLGYVAAIALVFLLTIIAVTIAWRLSKSITGPIKDLAFGFRMVGEGDLDISVKTKAKDEIAYLLRSFNAMVSDLKTTQRKLLQSERVAAWKDVARQISHEIKNPLTPIQLSLHRLRKKIDVPAAHSQAVEESFETIEEEIESLRKIAIEFSEFARMPKPSPVKTSLNGIIVSAASLYENNKNNIRIIVDLSDNVPDTMLDPEQIKRVFINILTNSIDAAGEKGSFVKLTSSFDREKSMIEVIVSDDGEGMDSETLSQIFDPYFTTKSHGTGLGMPVIKQIVEEHGGIILVESQPGEGTSVNLRFPVRS